MITIYTVITNNYLNLVPQDYIPGFRYICFTDGSCVAPEPWETIVLDSDIKDPIELSRYPKILSHHFFKDGDITVYFDAREKMNITSLIHALQYTKDHDIIVPQHQWRITYCDDMIWLYLNGLITEDEVKLKTDQLFEIDYDFKKHICVFGGYIIRKNTKYVRDFENEWWDQYNNFDCYAKRDQIPFGITCVLKGISKHLFLNKNYELYVPNTAIEKNKTTDNPSFRPEISDIVRVQTYLINKTQCPFISELVMSKPLTV